MATDQILPALAQAQAAYPKVGKLKKGHYGNYADMVSVMESVRAPNTAAGLIVIHLLGIEGGVHYTETQVIHCTSEQRVSSRLRLDPELSEQSLGKAITYARRYCLMGLLGICAEEDTDGQEAEDEQQARKKAAAKRPAAPPAKDTTDGKVPAKRGPAQELVATCMAIMKGDGLNPKDGKAVLQGIYAELLGNPQGDEPHSTKDIIAEKLGAKVLARVRQLHEPPPPGDEGGNKRTAEEARF